jgi:hypothetical protein
VKKKPDFVVNALTVAFCPLQTFPQLLNQFFFADSGILMPDAVHTNAHATAAHVSMQSNTFISGGNRPNLRAK